MITRVMVATLHHL